MNHRTFDKLAEQHRLRARTREALRLVLVLGWRWREAEKSTGVARSTILRAGRRIGAYD